MNMSNGSALTVRRRSVVQAVVTALALVSGACGSGGSSASEADVSAYGNQKYTDSAGSPLAEYMGFGDPRKQEAQAREQFKKQQEKVAACMIEQGFEYIPFVESGGFFSGQDSFGDLTRKEFAEKWGFGISTMLSADGTPVEGGPGGREPSGEAEDPNQEIRQAMSESAGAAYDKALYGDIREGPPGLSTDAGDGSDTDDGSGDTGGDSSGATTGIPDFESMGCQGKGYESLSGLDQKDEEKVQKAFEELGKRVEADKRTRAANLDYGACMKTAGFPEVKKPDDAFGKVASKLDTVYESSTPAGDGPGVDSDEGSTDDGTTESGPSEAFPIPGSGGPQFDSAELEKVQKYELSLAKAELPCRAAFDLATAKVREEYEEQFIETNRELLDKSKAAGGLG